MQSEKRASERGIGERPARTHGRGGARFEQRARNVVEQRARIAGSHRNGQRIAPLLDRAEALVGHGLRHRARHEGRRGVAPRRKQEAHPPRRAQRLGHRGLEQTLQQPLQLGGAPVGTRRGAAAVIEANDVGPLRERSRHPLLSAVKVVEPGQHKGRGRLHSLGKQSRRLRRFAAPRLLQKLRVTLEHHERIALGRAQTGVCGDRRRQMRQRLARQAREQVDDARRGFERRPFGLQAGAAHEQCAIERRHDAAPVAEQIPPVAHPRHRRLHARSQRARPLRERAAHAVGSGGTGNQQHGRETRRQPRFQICAGGVQHVARMVEYVMLKRHAAYCTRPPRGRALQWPPCRRTP